MKKVILNIFAILYIVLGIFVTICLISYNEYSVTVLGKSMLIPITTSNTKLNKGDLLIISKNKDYDVNDEVFYFNEIDEVFSGRITNYNDETITIDGVIYSKEKVISKTNNGYHYAFGGIILSFLMSKYVYLFGFIFPVLVLFLYELYVFGIYIKKLRGIEYDEEIDEDE